MKPQCDLCKYSFIREQGFFLGAMMVSYGMAVVITAPVVIGLLLLHATLPVVLAAAIVELIVCSPLVFRYSRVIWLHIDFLFDPH